MKTYILDEIADYTQGTIVVTCNNLKDFIAKCKKEEKRQQVLFLNFKKEWEIKNGTILDGQYYSNLGYKQREDYSKYNNEISNEYNNFFGIKLKDIKTKIIKDKEHYWVIIKEFDSNLSEGVHYYGSYCA